MKISDKREMFCREYLVDMNGTQAVMRSGYTQNPKSASVTATNLLADFKIQARLKELMAERSARTEITADFVLAGLKETALRCLQKKPVMEFDQSGRQMVQATDEEGNGIWEFDSSGANRAFELLGRHVGIFGKDNAQKTPTEKPLAPIDVDKIITALKKNKKTK